MTQRSRVSGSEVTGSTPESNGCMYSIRNCRSAQIASCNCYGATNLIVTSPWQQELLLGDDVTLKFEIFEQVL